MRQVNPEAPRGYTKLINKAGRLWFLGLKTEKDDNVIETKNGAATEVLGGLLYPAGTVDATTSLLKNGFSLKLFSGSNV